MNASEDLPGSTADRVLVGRDLICFSNDWDGDPLSKTHLMRLLARENRILWVNSIGYRMPTASRADLGRVLAKLRRFFAPVAEVEPNLFVLNPLAIPCYGRASRAANRLLLRNQVLKAARKLGFSSPITWAFLPGAAVVAGSLGESAVIYYCVDEFSAFAGVTPGTTADLEADLLTRSDLVIVTSEQLLRSKSATNPRTRLVRHGVDFDHFRRALDPSTAIPRDIADLPRPVIGYFGLIAEDWVDLEPLVHLAGCFPDASLVLIGKSTMDLSPLQAFPNVHILGRKPYADLPSYCRGFDAALIPFPISELTLNSNPLKAREYLAAGLPVVSTPIPEVARLPHCRIAEGPEAFALAVRAALSDPTPRAERSEAMRSESWQSRLVEIRRHLAEALEARYASPTGVDDDKIDRGR